MRWELMLSLFRGESGGPAAAVSDATATRRARGGRSVYGADLAVRRGQRARAGATASAADARMKIVPTTTR